MEQLDKGVVRFTYPLVITEVAPGSEADHRGMRVLITFPTAHALVWQQHNDVLGAYIFVLYVSIKITTAYTRARAHTHTHTHSRTHAHTNTHTHGSNTT